MWRRKAFAMSDEDLELCQVSRHLQGSPSKSDARTVGNLLKWTGTIDRGCRVQHRNFDSICCHLLNGSDSPTPWGVGRPKASIREDRSWPLPLSQHLCGLTVLSGQIPPEPVRRPTKLLDVQFLPQRREIPDRLHGLAIRTGAVAGHKVPQQLALRDGHGRLVDAV